MSQSFDEQLSLLVNTEIQTIREREDRIARENAEKRERLPKHLKKRFPEFWPLWEQELAKAEHDQPKAMFVDYDEFAFWVNGHKIALQCADFGRSVWFCVWSDDGSPQEVNEQMLRTIVAGFLAGES